ncbi:DUF4238 domain-containing protein [Ruminococcus flavefaciens]|uniref:DUF4238 domain-containing protein n=1 Tax=Ruminococcus flavefaciens TaxID=1265 RepID=UPI0026F086CE|nr:DUF4238 domain-containing protein [Ruminococcus flavefaciens]
MSTAAKYHHLIPQTYMSPWANESGTLMIENINDPGVFHERNKENIGGVNDFHSIMAGMPICTEDDAELIFASLAPYSVLYDGKLLASPLDYNNYFWDFDNWKITRSNGSPVSKKKIKHLIDQVKIKDIEENWSIQYENKWNDILKHIQTTILSTSAKCVTAFEREYLTLFYTALDWRGFTTNCVFESEFKKIMDLFTDVEIPENERILPSLKTAAEEMRHYLLLKWYREFLNKSGVIYKEAKLSFSKTNFHFLIADGNIKFLTSDSPVFVYNRKDGTKMGLLPITPDILMVKGKCLDTKNFEKYYITQISDDAVRGYNDAIKNNATEFIIHPN